MIVGIFLLILMYSMIIHGAIVTTMPLHYYALGAIPLGIILFLMVYVGFFASHETKAMKRRQQPFHPFICEDCFTERSKHESCNGCYKVELDEKETTPR